MGWSCTAAASRTLDRWADVCRKANGSSNTYSGPGGQMRFFECDGAEHDDGRITGDVFAVMLNGYAQKVGTFEINPDGSVAKAPAGLEGA